MSRYFIENCCTSVEAVRQAIANGAGRIELCENLPVGGVTPSGGLIAEVMSISTIPVNVLVRPRGGDFVFSEAEVEATLESIRFCKEAGVNGVVIGALTGSGDVDMAVMRRLVEEARPLSVTFHRAFDVCRDPVSALEDVISLGCDRLLTSGHETSAYEGRHFIKTLVEQAAGRILVMPGCGVRSSNLQEIASITRASEFHGTDLSLALTGRCE